jgi:hypothetical protein
MEELNKLKEDLRTASLEVKSIKREMRAASFKQCSQYSKNLKEGELQKAVEKQFDAIEKISELVVENKITCAEAERAVRAATR